MPAPENPAEPMGERCGGPTYPRPSMLGPRQIRSARFTRTRFLRRGLDSNQVRRFLAWGAEEVALLRAEVDRARQDAATLRGAMRARRTRLSNQRSFSETQPTRQAGRHPNA